MEFSENKPIYVQIIDYFCSQILDEKWQQEDRIPSVREIAVKMEVNPNTAIRAFHYLQKQGILYNQRGVGYFVEPDAYQKVKQLKREEFLNEKLPVFFKEMNQLGFTLNDIKKRFSEFE